mmetsp:Transcript_47037/g.123433  ORF Transcript_47037/g.123433 Transcript_47037/m.123433 type:complete len:231 (-) Transcript_47037:2028-2720(-)
MPFAAGSSLPPLPAPPLPPLDPLPLPFRPSPSSSTSPLPPPRPPLPWLPSTRPSSSWWLWPPFPLPRPEPLPLLPLPRPLLPLPPPSEASLSPSKDVRRSPLRPLPLLDLPLPDCSTGVPSSASSAQVPREELAPAGNLARDLALLSSADGGGITSAPHASSAAKLCSFALSFPFCVAVEDAKLWIASSTSSIFRRTKRDRADANFMVWSSFCTSSTDISSWVARRCVQV